MSLPGLRRLCIAVLAALALVFVAAPSYAMTEEECAQQAINVGDACLPEGDGYVLVEGTDDFGPFGEEGEFGESGFPDGFAVLFVLVFFAGIGVTVWKVITARQLATEAGMDPDRATGMTLLDEGGFSATYLASSLRTAPSTAGAEGAEPRPAADRLAELKALLDSGAITQAEYDERRKAIIDSV